MGAHFREAAMVEAAVQNILNRPLELAPIRQRRSGVNGCRANMQSAC